MTSKSQSERLDCVIVLSHFGFLLGKQLLKKNIVNLQWHVLALLNDEVNQNTFLQLTTFTFHERQHSLTFLAKGFVAWNIMFADKFDANLLD